MHEHRADALQLTPGQPVSLLVKGNPRPVTRDPLSDAQIVSLVREIAPGDLAALVTPGAQLSFAYHAPTGSPAPATASSTTEPACMARAPANTPWMPNRVAQE